MKVSVITINFNNVSGLRMTIESVVGQSYKDYEYIVIDGNSSDGSKDVLKLYDQKISYWVSEPDRGIYHAMNKGIAVAKGDYCIFMNSGDYFYDSFVLEHFIDLGTTDDIVIGKVHDKMTKKIWFAPPQRDISLYFLYSSTIPHQGTFIKTELQKKYLYDETLRIVADWKFFVQAVVLSNCSLKYVDLSVAFFDTKGVSTLHPLETWNEKCKVLSDFFSPRVISDMRWMKESECLTLRLAPILRKYYKIDKLLYKIGTFFLKIAAKNKK